MVNYSNHQNIAVRDGSTILIKPNIKDHGLFKKITQFSNSSWKMAKDGPAL